MFKIQSASGAIGIRTPDGWVNISGKNGSTRQGFLTEDQAKNRAAKKQQHLRNKAVRAEENRNRSLNGGKKGK